MLLKVSLKFGMHWIVKLTNHRNKSIRLILVWAAFINPAETPYATKSNCRTRLTFLSPTIMKEKLFWPNPNTCYIPSYYSVTRFEGISLRTGIKCHGDENHDESLPRILNPIFKTYAFFSNNLTKFGRFHYQ